MFIPRYIVFENAEKDHTGALWTLGYASHAQLWQFFHRQDSDRFYRPLNAGMCAYSTKKKKFLTYGDSSSLNLLPGEEDAKLLQEVLTNNKTLRVVVADVGLAPELTFIFSDQQTLLEQYFSKCKIYGVGKITFKIHDSSEPYKVEFTDIKGDVLDADYVKYMQTFLSM